MSVENDANNNLGNVKIDKQGGSSESIKKTSSSKIFQFSINPYNHIIYILTNKLQSRF